MAKLIFSESFSDGSNVPKPMLVDATTRRGQVDVLSSALPLDAATETTLSLLNSKDFATEVTLASLFSELQLKANLADTQPVSATSLPLPLGAATSALQLADGHNVTVDNVAGTNPVPVEGNVAAGAAISGAKPVVIGVQDTGGNAVVPTGIAAGPFTVLGSIIVDTAGNPVSVNNGSMMMTGDEAHDAADAGNPLKIGGKARTANPTAVANGDRVDAYFDDLGCQVITKDAPRDLVVSQDTIITNSTTETTILTAGAAGVFHDLKILRLINASNSSVIVEIRDETTGTLVDTIPLPPKGGLPQAFEVPLPQTTAANNWTAKCLTSVDAVYIFVQAIEKV